mmetsp:Transcript_11350/g.32925  ORF Transcript_11350/g.32925 Transcript_11350/m.32925 type:complete len:221 (-) Transcript_11350:1114-1776(-)
MLLRGGRGRGVGWSWRENEPVTTILCTSGSKQWIAAMGQGRQGTMGDCWRLRGHPRAAVEQRWAHQDGRDSTATALCSFRDRGGRRNVFLLSEPLVLSLIPSCRSPSAQGRRRRHDVLVALFGCLLVAVAALPCVEAKGRVEKHGVGVLYLALVISAQGMLVTMVVLQIRARLGGRCGRLAVLPLALVGLHFLLGHPRLLSGVLLDELVGVAFRLNGLCR